MKINKIYYIGIIGFLIIHLIGTGVYSTQNINNDEYQTFTEQNIVEISDHLTIKDNNDYVSLELQDCNTYLTTPGKPMIPKMIKKIELPFGIKNVQVTINPKKSVSYQLSKQITPSLPLLPLTIKATNSYNTNYIKDTSIYNQNNPYPDKCYSYRIGSGINSAMEHKTFLIIDVYPIKYLPLDNQIILTPSFDLTISYDLDHSIQLPLESTYDLLIIAPNVFSEALQPLIDHKQSLGLNVHLKTTEEIYSEFNGIDKPEQIKFCIKNAVEEWNVPYVLLVGGLKSVINAKPRDDSNQGSSAWHVPVRYTNMYDDPAFPLLASSLHDPGVISDLYYADLYTAGGSFSSWDGNNDGIFASLGMPDVDDDPTLDFYPDVSLSRLACRSIDEVNTVVDKIITYEQTVLDPSWFKKMIVISGDGFLDQTDLNIQWDTNTVGNGNYTIFAQSFNPQGKFGPILSINITKDNTQESRITYSHDDHLNPAIKQALNQGFPTDPVAEIVSVSEGDLLGNTDIAFDPAGNDYCNEFYFWANVSYVNSVLTIRGKSYDPKPYGNLSSIHVWITDEQDQTVFSTWRNNTEMYYEGEWTTGEKLLLGRGGALYYMPDDFEKDILWGSNGRITCVDDTIEAINQGAGFVFFSGHGSPNVWADQYPGIAGDRGHSSFTGMEVTKLSIWNILGLFSGKRTIQDLFPMFPMDGLSNGNKLPIAVVGGCHNSQFNVSMIRGIKEGLEILFPSLGKSYMWCHGYAIPETFSWRLIRNPNGGAIASMGNTGLGYGMPGKALTTGGGDSWITIEFFKQYGTEGRDILGDAYTQTLNSYIDTFDMTDLSAGHPKTITQWVLLGDPSLKIGGYS